MIIVTGHLSVAADDRDRVVELSRDAVVAARASAGCLDFAVSADSVERDRVNITERWTDREALDRFRGSGPEGEVGDLIRSFTVDEFDLASDESAGDGIRELLESRVTAVKAKDLDALAAVLAEDVESFNVLPPHRIVGREAVLESARGWFDGYASDIGYDLHDLTVTAAGDVGFAGFLYHVTGTLDGGADVDMWVRATLGCRRQDGGWLITHDHESVPWDPETGLGVLTR
ncbi:MULTISPECIES: SgcJ/EcaC family oxidoreductase [unclassified Knoellia]|uniref:SgcJ/EcaC family oxidoreductase n=1 Tax=Knoellia altitudinis TaxID=3404795 RepID=UPI00361023F8